MAAISILEYLVKSEYIPAIQISLFAKDQSHGHSERYAKRSNAEKAKEEINRDGQRLSG
jgi:hypothetical protein